MLSMGLRLLSSDKGIRGPATREGREQLATKVTFTWQDGSHIACTWVQTWPARNVMRHCYMIVFGH